MDTIEFSLKEDFIPLIQLLKFTGIAESGAHASEMVEAGMVLCNDLVESRKRYKVRAGDRVQFQDTLILVK